MEIDQTIIFERIDEFVKTWRSGKRKEAVEQAQSLAEDMAEVVDIDEKVYRALVFNLRFTVDYSKPHILFYNRDPTPLTPRKIINAENCAGSEEALYQVAQGFVRLGWRVTIVAGIPPFHGATLPNANPCWVPSANYSGLDVGKVDVVIAWRSTEFYRLSYFANNAKVFYCPHDWLCMSQRNNILSGILYLTEKQRENYIKNVPEIGHVPSIIGGNGIDPKMHEPIGERDQKLCIYASSYNRGLMGVLNVWEQVIATHPDARLHIYYGRESFGQCSPEEMAAIVAKITSLTAYGVEEKGRVSHETLAKAMSGASIIVNTSKYPETYGITFVKAQASGMIPVITNSVDRDIVYEEVPLLDSASASLEDDFLISLINRLGQASEGVLEDLREKCRKHVMAKHTWDSAVGRMEKFIKSQMEME